MKGDEWLAGAAHLASAALADAEVTGYVVGGCLRDRLLGRRVSDLDLVIEGDPVAWGHRIANLAGGTAVDLADSPALVRVAGPGGAHLDLLSVRGGSIMADLALRDLTINALGAELLPTTLGWLFSEDAPEPVLFDPFGGRADLSARVVRAVNARAFEDDPVRLLRAVRFSAELNFVIEDATISWMRHAAGLAARPARERIRDELLKLLAPDRAPTQLRLLESLGILGQVLPEVNEYGSLRTAIEVVAAAERVITWLEGETGPDWPEVPCQLSTKLREHLLESSDNRTTRRVMVKMAAMLHSLPGSDLAAFNCAGQAGPLDRILARLRLSQRQAGLVRRVADCTGLAAQMGRDGYTRQEAYRFFKATGDEAVSVLVVALASDLAGRASGPIDEALASRMDLTLQLLGDFLITPEEVARPPRVITGVDVMAVGRIAAGPQVAQVLETIRQAQADGAVRTRKEALEMARRLIL